MWNFLWLILKNRWAQLVLVITIAAVIISTLSNRLDVTEKKLDISRNNEKALTRDVDIWRDRYGQEHSKSLMFTTTLNQFKTEQDATSKAMMDMLNKQDKTIKNLKFAYYKETGIDTTITVVTKNLPDTVLDFSLRPHLVNVVTLKGNTASSHVALQDSLLLRGDSKRELVDPKKKTIVGRFFQNIFGRKHTVVEVEATHTNPLIRTKTQRYTEIIKD